MRSLRPGLALLSLQLLFVLSIAGKYLYERQTCPRVWTRATQADPALPLRGRYLAMRLLLDSCQLPRTTLPPGAPANAFRMWHVSLHAVDGKLVPRSESPSTAASTLTLARDVPCERASLSGQQLLFIPDRARLPFPLEPGHDLWVEVTLPPSGPPRPIRIALSGTDGFHPLSLD
jgi:hypothetical protein